MSKSQLLSSHICIEKCHARCCHETEMTLTKNDIHRLELTGYSKDKFIRQVDGFVLLNNENGHCVFLDPKTSRCKVYEIRPLGCRLYPLILSLEENKVVIDSEYCPFGHFLPLQTVLKYEKEVRGFIQQIISEREIND